MSKRKREAAPKLWIVLARCHRAMSLLVEHWAGAAGLSTSDFQLIETLLHKGPLTISEIQAKVLLATGSMTAAVDRVEKKGLVQRTTIKGDRRARRLVLTAEGRRLAGTVYKAHAAELEGAMSVLSDEETQALYSLSKKLGYFAAELLRQQKTVSGAEVKSQE